MHKSSRLAPNANGSGKGCLSFWKLRPPNLIRSLFVSRTGRQKMFEYSLLAAVAIRSAVPDEPRLRFRGGLDGQPRRQVGIILPHEAVNKIEIGRGSLCFAKPRLPRAFCGFPLWGWPPSPPQPL